MLDELSEYVHEAWARHLASCLQCQQAKERLGLCPEGREWWDACVDPLDRE